MNTLLHRPTLWQQAMIAGLLDLQCHLAQLDWSQPLTRTEIRAQWAAFPQTVFLWLPAAKRYASAGAVVRAYLQAEQHAMATRDVEDIPHDALVALHGGPPAWGPDPLVAGRSQAGGSATDTARPWMAHERYEW